MKKSGKPIVYPEIGTVIIHEIIDEYDYPILFIAKDIFNTFYLFQVLSDLNGKIQSIANKITFETYKKLKTNTVSIQSIYRNPDQNLFFLFTTYNGSITVERITTDNLESLELTDGDSFFGDLDNSVIVENSAMENAILTNQPTFDVIFDAPFAEYPAMEAKQHVNVVNSFIQMYQNLANNDDQLFVRMLPGSVKLRFEIQNTLFSDFEAKKVFDIFAQLIDSKDISQVGEILYYEKKSLTKFDNLLKSISKVKTEKIKLDFAVPNDSNLETILLNDIKIREKRNVIKEINNNVTTETIKIKGILTAADKNTLTIKIKSDDTDYTAKFERKLVDYKFVINNTYIFELEVNTFRFNDIKDYKSLYRLIEIANV